MRIGAALVLLLLWGIAQGIRDTELKSKYMSLSQIQKEAISNVMEIFGYQIKHLQEQSKDGKSLIGYERELGSIWQNPITWGICRAGMATVDFFLSLNIVRNTAENIISLICSYYMTYEVWSGAVHEMGDILVPQMINFVLSPSYSCARLAGFCSSPTWRTLDSQEYIDRVLSDKPEFLKNNDFVTQQYKMIDQDTKKRKTVKVLHMTDIHLDFDYTPGMNAHWNEPLCCRPINGPAPTPEDAAGKYGDYNCDLPTIVAEMMFDYIQAMPEKPDLVFWTGDNIAHDIWNQTAHKNADYTIKITDWMIEHWPEIPVFAVPGNHEFFPVNVMKFSEQDSLLNLVSEVWKHWLDDKSYHSFKTYGYYTMPLKGLNEDWKGFRVIGINTEACNCQNWYLFTQLNDPGNHLAWLEKTLKETEKAGERAYIIGHVQPGGGSWLNEWSVRYRSLIERYQHVVIAHLFGHSHSEFFNVFTDTKNSSSIGVMHGPGGVTTYTDDNPAFRIYDIDYETGYPVKAYKYFFNITKANLGNPEWEYAYELTEEYKLSNMSPESFKNLTLRFLSEDGIATKYLQNSESRSPHGMSIDCSSMGCRHSLYCSTNNIITFERRDCNGQKRIDFKNSLEDALYETFFDPWIEKSE